VDFRDHSFATSGARGAAGVRVISGGVVSPVDSATLDIDDPREVLCFVLTRCRPVEDVPLTERYFYFNFIHGARTISGNLRFVDAESGVVHIGYFDKHDRGFLRSGTFGAAENVRVECRANRASVAAVPEGISRVFRLRDAAGEPCELPEQLAARGWRCVCDIRDDSGHGFALAWHDAYATYAFLARDEELRACEPLAPIPGTDCSVGVASRYVFMPVTTGWSVLAGVSEANVRENTYFDGPFDQIPPRLLLKPRCAIAYPYVLQGGGIDDFGNFIDQPGHRVAVSPYQQYRSLAEFVEYHEGMIAKAASDDERIARACFEYKRLAHLRAPPSSPLHRLAISSTWPANHHGDESRSRGGVTVPSDATGQ
jgi:hypothetical protein